MTVAKETRLTVPFQQKMLLINHFWRHHGAPQGAEGAMTVPQPCLVCAETASRRPPSESEAR